jgi:hypothetical protein
MAHQHFHLGTCIPEDGTCTHGDYGADCLRSLTPFKTTVEGSAKQVRIHVEYDLAETSSTSSSRLIIRERGARLFEELKQRVLYISISKVYPLNPENIEVVCNDDRYKSPASTYHVPKILSTTYSPRSSRGRWTKSTTPFPRVGALEVIISWCETKNSCEWKSVVLFSRLNSLTWPNVDYILKSIECVLSPLGRKESKETSAAQNEDRHITKLRSEILNMKRQLCLEQFSKLPVDSSYVISPDEMRQISRGMLFLRVLKEELSTLEKKRAQLIDEVELLQNALQSNAALLDKLRVFEAKKVASREQAPELHSEVKELPPMRRIAKRAVEDDWSVSSVQEKDLLSIFLEQSSTSLADEQKRSSKIQVRS